MRVVGDGRTETYLEHIRDFSPAILINDLPTLEQATTCGALSHLGATTVNLVDTLDDLESTEQYEQVIVSVMNQDRETPEGFYGGPAYAILREHFRGQPEKEIREEPRLVLLSFGGSDPQGLTLKAARALQALPPEIEILAVAGPAFASRARSRRWPRTLRATGPLIDEAGGHISDLMLEADVMVGSGGMSVYEIAALGTPGVVLGQNAREDARMRDFARHGTVEYLGLGHRGRTRPPWRRRWAPCSATWSDDRTMSERGRALVDGLRGRPGRRAGAGAPQGAADGGGAGGGTMKALITGGAGFVGQPPGGSAGGPRRHGLRARQPLHGLHREHRAPEGTTVASTTRSTA